jgi:hypothetical protein
MEVDVDHGTRLELLDRTEKCLWCGDVLPGKKVCQRVDIQFSVNEAAGQQGLDFRSEYDFIRAATVVERLDPHRISDKYHPTSPNVVKRDRKHPVETPREIQPVLLISVDNYLRVGLGLKTVT